MSTTNLFNNYAKYFQGGVQLVAIPVAATSGNNDATVDFNGVVVNYWFVKSGSTGGASDTVQLSTVKRTGTASTLSSAISVNTIAAGTVVPMAALTLANAAVEQAGKLRVSGVAGTTSAAGVMYVLCAVTA